MASQIRVVRAVFALAAALIVGGYVVANVSYGINATDGTLVDAVSFDMSTRTGDESQLPDRARVRLSSTGDTWYSCWPDSVVSANRYRCPTLAPHANAATIDELRVVATTR